MSYKLTYFNIPGRAECIRLIFAHAGVSFTDKRIQGEEWPEFKKQTPWGQIPILETDGNKTLAQTVTICRFLGRRFHLTGKDEWEAVKCDEYVDACNDLFTEWGKYFFEKDAEKKAKLHEEFKANTVPKYLTKFNDVQKKNGGRLLVGTEITWADIFIADKLARLEQSEGPNVFDNYQELRQFKQHVLSQPKIKAHLDQSDKK